VDSELHGHMMCRRTGSAIEQARWTHASVLATGEQALPAMWIWRESCETWLELGTRGERAVHFALREAHALHLKAGSKNHEKQKSTRYHAVASTPDDVERRQCGPDARLLATGLAGAAKGAECLCELRRAAGRRAILDQQFEALHLSGRAEEQHLDVLVVPRSMTARTGA